MCTLIRGSSSSRVWRSRELLRQNFRSLPADAAPEWRVELFAAEHQISALMFAVWEAAGAPRTSCKIEKGGRWLKLKTVKLDLKNGIRDACSTSDILDCPRHAKDLPRCPR